MSLTTNDFSTFPDCTFLIDKSQGWTSFDAVNKIRRISRIKKVGHAGTLDPAATGLLIICSGKRTKLIDGYQAQEKVYSGTITLGFTTASYDSETEKVFVSDPSELTLNQIEDIIKKQFTGEIQQIPPMYSALKVDGKKLYELARKGKEVKREPRTVTISEFKVTRFEKGELDFLITCTKGTYIRSLANDLGQSLETGGYLSALRREKIGEYSVADSWTITQFEDHCRAYLAEIASQVDQD
ncbi:MAG: tRNA pseudouridine(55) synthase TruB [Bacteroidetes bacterium]|nr:tRNA pseudouridine(55) synthase TruB [Bacteroidota bacterium]